MFMLSYARTGYGRRRPKPDYGVGRVATDSGIPTNVGIKGEIREKANKLLDFSLGLE